MTNNGSKITLAKLSQKVCDYIHHNDKTLQEVKTDLKEIKEVQQKMMLILTSGDGKIKRNYLILNDHIRNHKWWATFIITLCGAIAVGITLIR